MKRFILLVLVFSLEIQLLLAQNNDVIVAKVGEETICYSEILSVYDYVHHPCTILEGWIKIHLLLNQTILQRISISQKIIKKEVNHKLDSLTLEYDNNRKNVEMGLNKKIKLIRDSLKNDYEIRLMAQEMKTQILNAIEFSDKDIEHFFEMNLKGTVIPERLEIGQIIITIEANQEEKEKTRQYLYNIQKLIESGDLSFERATDSLSQDRGSAIRGGKLGWHKRGELVSDFESAIFRMKKGEYRVVETQFGFHLIELLERKGDSYNSRHILIKPKVTQDQRKIVIDKLDSLRTEINQGNIAFEEAAQVFSDDTITVIHVAYENLPSPLFFAIDEDSLGLGDISKPIPYRTKDRKEAYLLFQIISEKKEREMSLLEDYESIRELAFEEKRKNTLNDWYLNASKNIDIQIGSRFESCDTIFKNNAD